eukprot:TRINITY_DN5774_c0_g1_i3.p1 TRINITY_DN5774_c0_g1~~TRINITY_DN5774_c0_g1_i3.p1  ORF type:complete len:215 (-),score=29.98 TRINITY_DN5774_c0_g1_i3:395-1039(-)
MDKLVAILFFMLSSSQIISLGVSQQIKEVFLEIEDTEENILDPTFDGTENCPTQSGTLLNTTQVSTCLNDMRSAPEQFEDVDPCNWVVFAPQGLSSFQQDDNLTTVAQFHAERNAFLQTPTGKFVDAKERFPSEVLSDLLGENKVYNLHVTVQAGPGVGGVFGTVSGWMCVQDRRAIALSCDFDLSGIGVSYNTSDGLYYTVKYQACSQVTCDC